jgi:adenosine deaminase
VDVKQATDLRVSYSIDLHTHLRGTITPDLAHGFAAAHGHYLSESLFDGRGGYRFADFHQFLDLYDLVGAVVQTPSDLETLANDYLVRCACNGTRYVEFMLSPNHSADNGIGLAEQLDAVSAGIERASSSGIRANVIVTAVRHKGPDAAIDLAEDLADLRHPVVTGFGLTGNEHKFDVRDFSGAFYVARDLGLGLTAHVGEWLGADTVLHAINELGLNRIGHGCSIVDDPAILASLADRGIGIEVCLSSNLMLGRVADLSIHPIKKMLAAGCAVSLATDDPGYFHTSPKREYLLAENLVNLDGAQLAVINENAISTAFCSDELKRALRQELAQ